MGIGGEYAAINSAIDELIPARFRGRVDLMVNGTYWAGAIIGTLGTFIFLNQLEPSIGWRVAFLLGPVLGLVIIFVRRHLPESPRWQVMHGHEAEAEKTIAYIEHEVEAGRPRAAEGARGEGGRDHAGGEDRLLRAGPGAVQGVPAAGDLRRHADDHAVVPLQRDLLHLHDRPDQLLRRGRGAGAAVPHRLRGRQPGRAVRARPPVRHRRPQEDDLRHLHPVRGPARRSPRSCSRRTC